MHLDIRQKPLSFSHVLGLAAVLLLSMLAGCSDKDQAGSTRPNVLLITVCSVRADHMSCYGYVRDTTRA